MKTTNKEAVKLETELREKRKQQQDKQQKQARIESAIDEQQGIIEQAGKLADTAAPLKQRRGALLAEAVATGTDNGKEIADIDTEIAKAEKSDDVTNLAKRAEAAKAREILHGLQAMFPPLEQAIEEDEKSIRVIQDQLLQILILEKLEQYKTIAFKLRDCFQDMLAMDEIIGKNGVRRHSQTRPFGQELIIPSYLDMGRTHFTGVAVHMSTDQAVEREVLEDVLKRLNEGYGVEV